MPDDYQRRINTGPRPDESDTWRTGDIVDFGGGGGAQGYTCRLRFVKLDPDDPIGFYAAEWLGDRWSGVSRGWTRGRFVRVDGMPGSETDSGS